MRTISGEESFNSNFSEGLESCGRVLGMVDILYALLLGYGSGVARHRPVCAELAPSEGVRRYHAREQWDGFFCLHVMYHLTEIPAERVDSLLSAILAGRSLDGVVPDSAEDPSRGSLWVRVLTRVISLQWSA